MATLRVTHTEDIVLDGRQQGSTRTMTFENIVDTYTRTFSFAQQALTSVYTTSPTALSGAVQDDSSVKYVRITNVGAGAIIINLIGESENHWAYEIQPTESYYLYSHNLSCLADDADDITTTEMRALVDVDEVKVYSVKDAGRVEVFIASTESKLVSLTYSTSSWSKVDIPVAAEANVTIFISLVGHSTIVFKTCVMFCILFIFVESKV